MIHLIWSLINGMFFLCFLYLIIGYIAKGKRIFKPQFKVVSIFILVIGIVQLISASSSEKKSNRIIIKEDYNKKNNSVLKKITLEDHLTFDINLEVKYSMDKKELIPIESNSFLTGIVSGFVWEFKAIQTNNFKPNNKTSFTVDGLLKWNLLGITVYSESKKINGIIE